LVWIILAGYIKDFKLLFNKNIINRLQADNTYLHLLL